MVFIYLYDAKNLPIFTNYRGPPKKVPDFCRTQLHKGRCSHPADTEAIDTQDLVFHIWQKW